MKTLDEYFEEYEDVGHGDVVRELYEADDALAHAVQEMHLYKARAERAEKKLRDQGIEF